MNWHHGIPNSCLVFLLLLSFSTSSEPSKGCIFGSVPIDTSDFPSIVKNLKKLLLLDYPVPVPVNLKQDEFCKELWHVHLIHRNLNRMINVSGSELEKSIRKLMIHTTFVEMCDINDSCVKFITTNISEFLEPIPSYLSDLRKKMEEFEAHDVPANFSNCTVIHCQPGQSFSVLQSCLPLQPSKSRHQSKRRIATPNTTPAENPIGCCL
ncbi:fms-related tyrosine kinase 3 ligand isoform X3 [Anolis carolinensis]|uniref:fms-related tyrosine kinase 3 ligand isoform X3 n=1 Tax=Anolis carolinensis TaxID=28377 RepID=UPI002F2B3AAA